MPGVPPMWMTPKYGVRGNMVLDGMTKWFMSSKAPAPEGLKLELQLSEEWYWYGYETRNPPDMSQLVLEEWSE